MGKQKAVTASSLLGEMLHPGLYKRSQGQITRQVTFASVFLVVLLGAWRMHSMKALPEWYLGPVPLDWNYLAPLLLVLTGTWLAYRLVNLPQFTDFLIAVEAEMNKVSWPSKAELIRSSVVVIFVIFAMAIVLFGYDLIWQVVFRVIGIIPWPN